MNTVVLIVDDSPLNIELARDVLEVQGYEVLTATNAEECFAVLATCRPDLILMDIGLPGKDGLQITRDLRAAPATRDLCIVAMTAHAMADDEQRARRGLQWLSDQADPDPSSGPASRGVPRPRARSYRGKRRRGTAAVSEEPGTAVRLLAGDARELLLLLLP